MLSPAVALESSGWCGSAASTNWGEGDTLIMLGEGNLAGQFVASPRFVELEKLGIVKGAPAEKFIEVLGVAVEEGWIEMVVIDPNPFRVWLEGKYEGYVVWTPRSFMRTSGKRAVTPWTIDAVVNRLRARVSLVL